MKAESYSYIDYCEKKKKYVNTYTNADLKISLYVCVHIKTTPCKFRIPNLKNSRVIYT